jgi:predicted transposase YdaD
VDKSPDEGRKEGMNEGRKEGRKEGKKEEGLLQCVNALRCRAALDTTKGDQARCVGESNITDA